MRSYPNAKYTLTLNDSQRKAVGKAVQLFVDLKDQKPEAIFPLLVKAEDENYSSRKEAFSPIIHGAFKYIYNGENPRRDAEYDRLKWLLDAIGGSETITMSSDQAHTLYNAVNLFMRLKLNQPNELIYSLINLGSPDFCERRDCAEVYLRSAFRQVFPIASASWKDDEWHSLYNTYQVIRYAFFKVENPTSKGVDSYPPTAYSAESLPTITYTKE